MQRRGESHLVPLLPRSDHCKRHEQQSAVLVPHLFQHLLDQGVVLEARAVLQGQLREGPAQGGSCGGGIPGSSDRQGWQDVADPGAAELTTL